MYLEIFQKLLTNLDEIKDNSDKKFDLLEKRAKMLIANKFGENSRYYKEISDIDYFPDILDVNENVWNSNFIEGLEELKDTIKIIIEELSMNDNDINTNSNMKKINIFISHSHKDKEIAKALADFFKYGLDKHGIEIRCTSADGYLLPAGASNDNQLKQEIFETKVFVGLIAPDSIASTYVLFELGARWGTKQSLLPLVVTEKDKNLVKSPLSSYNVLVLDNESQLNQLLVNIAELLEIATIPIYKITDFLASIRNAIHNYKQ